MAPVRPFKIMTSSTPEEIHCHTRLSATQMIAMLVPSRSFIIFGILMFVIWYNLVPATNTAGTLLIAALCLALLKLTIVIACMMAYRWRVSIDGNRVEFFQGSHKIVTCLMGPEVTKSITVVDSRWFPGMLQVARTDGTVFETLYGVCRTDLDIVAERLKQRLAPSPFDEQK